MVRVNTRRFKLPARMSEQESKWETLHRLRYFHLAAFQPMLN